MINFGDLALDIYPRFPTTKKIKWFTIYNNSDWAVLKKNIDQNNELYNLATFYPEGNIEDYMS